MFISKTKTKNTTTYYLVKSFKDPNTGKISTKTVERIGNTQEIQAKIGNKDINVWLKNYAKEKTDAAKDKNNPKVVYTFDKTKKIDRNNRIKNAGYIYLKRACEDLGLKRVCIKISNQENLKFDLYNVVSHIVYNIIFDSTEIHRTSLFNQGLMEAPKFKESDVVHALRILAKYSLDIQKMLYKYLKKNLKIDNSKLFYSCSNYSDINFQIYNSNDIEYPQQIITLTKVFFDSLGFPCMFITDNNVNRKYEQYETVKKFLNSNFKDASLYVLPESVYSSTDPQILSDFKKTYMMSNQSITNFSDAMLSWITNPAGWRRNQSKEEYNIQEIARTIEDIRTSQDMKKSLQSQIFYKYKQANISRPGSNKSTTQYVVVMFNYSLKLWLKQLRNSRFKNLEKADETLVARYKEALEKSEAYDGFYAVCVDSEEFVVGEILNVLTTALDQVDYMLRFVKNEFVADNLLSQEEAINTHYLTTFISLTIFKYITCKLKNRFTNDEVVEALKKIKFKRFGSEGWIPAYTPDAITDALSEAFGIDFDYEFITSQDMRKKQ